jgi:hypothetical protein
LSFSGRVVGLVGVTLAAGFVGWAWSPIKFQADMGILLTFMFLWNMLGALILIGSFLVSESTGHSVLNQRRRLYSAKHEGRLCSNSIAFSVDMHRVGVGAHQEGGATLQGLLSLRDEPLLGHPCVE